MNWLLFLGLSIWLSLTPKPKPTWEPLILEAAPTTMHHVMCDADGGNCHEATPAEWNFSRRYKPKPPEKLDSPEQRI